MKTLLPHLRLAIAGMLLSGCTSTIPVIGPAFECPANEAELAAKCAEPAPIATGATYQDLVLIAAQDRKNLVACEKNREFLQKVITGCNAEIRKHNEKIDELNKKFAGKAQ